MSSKAMFKCVIFRIVLILALVWGFTARESNAAGKGIFDKVPEANNGTEGANETVSKSEIHKNNSAAGTQASAAEGASILVKDSRPAIIPSANAITPSNTSNKEAFVVHDGDNSGKSGAKSKTEAEVKAITETGGTIAAQNANTKASPGKGGPANEASSTGNAESKVTPQKTEKTPKGPAKGDQGSAVKSKIFSEPDSETAMQPPQPNPDDSREIGDASNDNHSVKEKTDVGLEENDDGLEDPTVGNNAIAENKAGQAKGNRRGQSAPNMSAKIHYDDEPESSHFLAYLMTIGVLCIAAYVVAHNRHKIMGLILEGRQGRRSHRSGSTSRGVKYKRLQHEETEGENGVNLSSRDGGRVIY